MTKDRDLNEHSLTVLRFLIQNYTYTLGMDMFFAFQDFLTKFIQNGVRANDTTELTEIAEKVDPIVAEYLSHSDAEVQECLLGKETSIENTNDLTEAEDNHNTKTHNVHSISSCNTDSTVSLNMVASLSLHEDSLNDDNRSANISLPAVSDSRESVFEPDEPISSHQLSQNGATEASAHDPTVNMYENPSYGQESSGYIPKTFDFDQKDN